MTAIKGIIFDLGKVVSDVSFDKIFESWARNSNKPFSDIKRAFQFDNLYAQFERDELTASEFRKSLSKKLDISLSDQLFDEGWCNLYLDTYPEMNTLLARLKEKYRIVALTNTNKIHETVWKVKYNETLQHFEKVFSSSDMRTRKPEEQSFKIVLDYLEMKPEETILIDDQADNTKSAERMGIRSVLVSSPEQMIRELTKLIQV